MGEMIVPIAMVCTIMMGMGVAALFLAICEWRENRNRKVYARRTGRVPF